MLTVKPSSSVPELSLAAGSYSEFTLTLLYKLSTGPIASPVNLVSIPSSLTVSFQTNTQVNLGACALTATFTTGVDQGDWLSLGITYDMIELRAYR